MKDIWLQHYPAGVPAQIATDLYPSLVDLIEDAFGRFSERTAYRYFEKNFSYAAIDAQSRALAAWLQAQGVVPGDRVAIMLPNVPQYPVAVAAVLRIGAVVVNVNPLYTPRELEHQLVDCGARIILLLENFATTLQQVMGRVPIQTVLLTSLGEMLPFPKGRLVDFVVRHVKKMVPAYDLPGALRLGKALAAGAGLPYKPVNTGPEDLAVLQYTGGTTGTSKGAMLLNRNLVANVLQSEAWYQPALRLIPAEEQILQVCALPLYHIFGFNINMMLGMRVGACNILIPNPRDLRGVFKALEGQRFHTFPAVNTLFHALLQHPDFDQVDWSRLKLSLGGGMAVQQATAREWLKRTGCAICEGYGLSETSPTVSCNPTDSREFTGTIGLPLPSTEIRLLDDEGQDVPLGESGEIAIRGPQLMAGYWQRPQETAEVMTADGFFRTGDIGVFDERGYLRIVDRKKDIVLVSGFNVYPTEVEDVVMELPGVLECAAIGVPDEHSGEAVKLVVVRKNPALTEAEVRGHCEHNLTGYKRPKVIEFRTELPKTTVGKVLRRKLREAGTP